METVNDEPFMFEKRPVHRSLLCDEMNLACDNFFRRRGIPVQNLKETITRECGLRIRYSKRYLDND